MSNRDADGAWYSTYTTAWTVLAMNEVVKGTGELGGGLLLWCGAKQRTPGQWQAAGAEQLTLPKRMCRSASFTQITRMT